MEYGLRVPIIIAIFFSMSGFMRDRFGNEFLQGRNPLPMLVFSVLEYFARKTLTAVAGTDAMISGFLQSESWRAGFTDQDKTVNKDLRAQEWSLSVSFFLILQSKCKLYVRDRDRVAVFAKDRLDTLSSIILSSSKTRACAIADGSDDVKNPRSGQEDARPEKILRIRHCHIRSLPHCGSSHRDCAKSGRIADMCRI